MILIVDDKPENLFSLQKVLERHGLEADVAQSGEEALKKILRHEYELIILDVQMPGMDGFEVAETLGGYSKARDIPILFLSAVGKDKRFISRGYSSGGADYIAKPVDPDILLLKAQHFIRLFRQTRELREARAALSQEVAIRREAQEMLEYKVGERTAELLQANRQLQERNEELQQFVFVASHDLKEPLRKIQTFSKMLLERFGKEVMDGAMTDLAQRIDNAACRMTTLINDLLQFARLDDHVAFVPIPLADVIKSSLSDLEMLIREKNAAITVGPMPLIECSPALMQQVFQNLVSNAIRFAKPDEPPCIRITSEKVALPLADAEPDEEGSYLRICITDNGMGFDEAYLPKIFTIFQRLHTNEVSEGTGIGLSITQKIVQKHGGLITAKSKEGQGATFIIVLPFFQNPAT